MPTLVKTPGGTTIKWKDPGGTWRDVQAVYPPVSADPLLHTGSGVAARNGTTSHTIPFGFTSATGSLLVVAVAASVTNAATGWTERLNPTSATELSVYTKTSTGDSSITVTHNASNYPANWYAWEWVSGSSYHSGAQSTGNNETMPTLGSLPGTAVELFAAMSVGVNLTGGSTPTMAWTAGTPGWAEVLDLYTADDGVTDGVLLGIARAQAFTGTSVTPVVTLSITNPPSSIVNRQKVVWAVDPP